MNEHLSPRARVVVACIGIRQRTKGVGYFIGEHRRTGSARDLSAACLHARHLRERCEQALRDAQLDQAGVPANDRRRRARRMG